MFLYRKANAAKKRYLRSSVLVACAYVTSVGMCSRIAHRGDLSGRDRVYLAAVPSFAILVFIIVLGRYLREEPDEYERDLTVRCLLWGIAVVLATTTFTGFLRIYGWPGALPPLTEFMSFWLAVAVAKASYRLRNRSRADD